MNLFTKFRYILSSRYQLRIGAGHGTDGSIHYSLVAINPKGLPRLLWTGTGLKQIIRFITPLPIYTDTGMVPTMLVHGDLDGIEANYWVDQNEEKIIPRGLTADQTYTEWEIVDNHIYLGSVTKKAFDPYATALKNDGHLLASVSVPLWDLGALYWSLLKTPFVLWKVTATGSLFGFVNDGVLNSLVNYWPSRVDLKMPSPDLCSDIGHLLDSLTSKNRCPIIIIPDAMQLPQESFALPGYNLIPAPNVVGVSPPHHESYALATAPTPGPNLAPFQDIQTTRNIAQSRRTSLKIVTLFTGILILLVTLAALFYGGIALGKFILNAKITPIREEITQLNIKRVSLDSLHRVINSQARFLDRESVITLLLNNLQTAFPEGVWAEEISISERDTDTWALDIIALANSSSLIPQFIKGLEKIKGIDAVRMLYSEQTTIGRTSALRLKIETVWRDR